MIPAPVVRVAAVPLTAAFRLCVVFIAAVALAALPIVGVLATVDLVGRPARFTKETSL